MWKGSSKINFASLNEEKSVIMNKQDALPHLNSVIHYLIPVKRGSLNWKLPKFQVNKLRLGAYTRVELYLGVLSWVFLNLVVCLGILIRQIVMAKFTCDTHDGIKYFRIFRWPWDSACMDFNDRCAIQCA